MEKQRLTYLLQRYSDNIATPEEHTELFDYIDSGKNQELFDDVVVELMQQYKDPAFNALPYGRAARDAVSIDKMIFAKSGVHEAPVPRVPFFKRAWIRYAALIIMLLGAGTTWLLLKRNTSGVGAGTVPAPMNDVAPGKNGAILTLADGSKMVLDSIPDGVIARQDAANLILTDGQLSYSLPAATASDIFYNAITTTKGRQFKLVLPDGTRVWLNAQSSIRYPTVFPGNERRVSITGEAYFEVAKNANSPFYVNVNDKAEVQAIGTAFNINAYDNEPALKATLLEGSVRVTTKAVSQLLRPGEQAIVDLDGKMIEGIIKPDINKITAWKNGYFNFNDASLYEITRQLERWYAIDIVYENDIPPIQFQGKLQRDLNLSQILRILEKMNVKFTIDNGRKLIITNPD